MTFPDGGQPDSKTWYDRLGRQIRTETEGFDGTIIQTQTYDAKGNVKTSTQPYKSGETYITTTNHYQPNYNWLVSVEQGALGTTSMTYAYSAGALTLTTTAPAGTSSKVTDASGKVTSATDNGGTLTYSYYNHGGLKEVKNGGVTLTSNEYDEAGRQTKLVDANAGTTTYVYDALGQLTSRNDSRTSVNKTESFTYDNLNRLTSATVSGSAAFTATYASNGNIATKTDAGTYAYHTTKFNAVTEVTNPAPSPIPLPQQNISYTAFMQPEVITEANTSNVPFELTYTYGADYERIKSVLKQNSAVINTRYYFSNGFEKDVTGGITRYIQYISSPVGLVAIIESNGGSHSAHYTYRGTPSRVIWGRLSR